MRTLHLFALAGVLGTAVAPAALLSSTTIAFAQSQPPSKAQLETAVKSANPTIGQLRKLKKLEPNIPNMTPDQVKQSMGQIFTMQQLAMIDKSLQAQGVSMAH